MASWSALDPKTTLTCIHSEPFANGIVASSSEARVVSDPPSRQGLHSVFLSCQGEQAAPFFSRFRDCIRIPFVRILDLSLEVKWRYYCKPFLHTLLARKNVPRGWHRGLVGVVVYFLCCLCVCIFFMFQVYVCVCMCVCVSYRDSPECTVFVEIDLFFRVGPD